MSIAEIWRGILLLPEGRKRLGLESWFAGPDGPPRLFAGRILPFDEAAALAWGRMMVDGKSQGFALDVTDAHIAAIADANNCTLVTANVRDFPALRILDPMAD